MFNSPNAPSVAPLVLLSRQVSFCVGLQLRHPDWDLETNRSVFGKSCGPHGSEFHLRVALRGPISPDDGMIVNLSEVKPQVMAVAQRLEGKFLDAEIAYFASHRPTLENIARFVWNELPQHIGSGRLYRLEVDQAGGAGVEISRNESSSPTMKICHSYEFAAAHRLFTPSLSEEENWERFDKCSNPAGHGHNFQLRVWVQGVPDDETGYIINPRLLDFIVEDEVYRRFDHKHLNQDCPEFTETGLVPTSENLALTIFGLLQTRLNSEGFQLCRIGLQETQKNYFEVEA